VLLRASGDTDGSRLALHAAYLPRVPSARTGRAATTRRAAGGSEPPHAGRTRGEIALRRLQHLGRHLYQTCERRTHTGRVWALQESPAAAQWLGTP
jgi:hypothetical protein